MPINAMCCGKWITVSENGAGFWSDFDCRAFMSDQNPTTEAQRRAICQQLFDADALCPEIAPCCEPFKEDMQRERSRKRDEAERSASGQWPPASRAEDDVWDWIHTGLDLAGLIPGLGVVPDAVNAGIYSIEGDWLNAGISIVSMVEGIGQGATATRTGVKVSRKAAKELGKDGLARVFRQAITRTEKEAALRASYHNLAGRSNLTYRQLKKETKAWNAGMRELHPGHGNPDLRLDAHHVFEGRTFKKFKNVFSAKGITGYRDLPAIVIPYEAHIRSGKGLGAKFKERIARNITEAGEDGALKGRTFTREELQSLSEGLKKAVDLDSIHSVEEAIEAYERYYSKHPKWWDKVKPVFEDLRKKFGMPSLDLAYPSPPA